MLGLGLGLNKDSRRGGAAPPYVEDPDAAAYFAQVATQPDQANKVIYNDLFISTKAGVNNFSKSDILFIRGAQYEDNALRSLKNPTWPLSTKISTPTFEQYRGYTGGAGKALDWNWIPATNGVNFTLNSACLWVYSRTDLNGLFVDLGVNQTAFAQVILARYVGEFYGNLNGAGNTTQAIGHSLGLFSVVRTDANTLQLWVNGVLLFTANPSSVSLASRTMYELAMNLNGVLTFPSDRQIFASGAGSGTMDQLELYNSIQAAATSWGANV